MSFLRGCGVALATLFISAIPTNEALPSSLTLSHSQSTSIHPTSGSPTRPPFSLSSTLHSISDFSTTADSIISYATSPSSPFRHSTYNRLAEFTDTIGNRISGSENLVKAEQYMLAALQADGLENVHLEAVTIPNWIRGKEFATLHTPFRDFELNILGLGNSVNTSGTILTAPILVVNTFEELKVRASEAKGKIVVFNQYCDWKNNPVYCYGLSVNYRDGANAASSVGAVAALVRSVTGFSINSPHTGMMSYDDGIVPIPTASVTVEDAEMMYRIQQRNQSMTISLYMEAEMKGTATGHNVVAEIIGSTYPEETVLVSGHLDSWDVGHGAMDDGGGALISWSVLAILKKLNIRPKRTVRLVMWSCEEFGGIGSQQYFDAHKDEIDTMSLVMESDLGVFRPRGIQFAGSSSATAIMSRISILLTSINASSLVGGGEGTDIDPWQEVGVPGASLDNAAENYFDFHHTAGDTMSVLDPDEMDACAAVWAVTAWAVADLDHVLPRL